MEGSEVMRQITVSAFGGRVIAGLAPYPVKPLGETAFFQKRLFLSGYLAVQKIAGQIQKRERRVGDELCGTGH